MSNKFPTKPFNGLAIIGEAPGADEVRDGEPFVGPSGRLLNAVLAAAGIDRDACFVGNVCQHQPAGNKLEAFEWSGQEIQEGIIGLQQDLAEMEGRVKVCLLLGNAALHVFHSPKLEPRKTAKSGFQWPAKVSVWRGTPRIQPNVIGIATYHPAAVLRQYAWMPVLRFDVKKAARYLRDGVQVLQRTLDVALTPAELAQRLDGLIAAQLPVSFDIEGGVQGGVSCIGFSNDPTRAFVVPFVRQSFVRYWTTDVEAMLWEKVKLVLERQDLPKIAQNALYDCFVLKWTRGIDVRPIMGDTMLLWWELYCELEKSLDFQASILTDEPFWKHERVTDDDVTALTYCAKDAAVTLECYQKMQQ